MRSQCRGGTKSRQSKPLPPNHSLALTPSERTLPNPTAPWRRFVMTPTPLAPRPPQSIPTNRLIITNRIDSSFEKPHLDCGPSLVPKGFLTWTRWTCGS